MTRKRTIFIYIALILLSILLIINTALIFRLENNISNDSGISNRSGSGQTQTASVKVNDDVTKVVNKVNDSVVTIALYQGDKIVGNGSGSIIDLNNGRAKIVTNNHVVDVNGDITIKVIFANKKEKNAKIIGKDKVSDLALLETKIDFKVKPIAIGNSDALQVGESVIAIGSPLDVAFTGTVTRGIISGLNRTIETDTNGDNVADYEMQVLQTDTTINPGNSGGPLINMAGQMIGINTSKISSEGFEGMGFSIPANEAMNILESLSKNKKVERPKLGISYVAVSTIPEYAQERSEIPESITEGIYIKEVQPNSPAANASLKSSDVITKVNGKKVTSTSVFTSVLYNSKKGNRLKLEVYRKGKATSITVTL